MDFKILNFWIYFIKKENRRTESFLKLVNIFKRNIVEKNSFRRKNLWSPPLPVLGRFCPPRLQNLGEGGGERDGDFSRMSFFSCTYLMSLHIWRSNVHIWNFIQYDLLQKCPSIWFWVNHCPCRAAIKSANANVYLNIL